MNTEKSSTQISISDSPISTVSPISGVSSVEMQAPPPSLITTTMAVTSGPIPMAVTSGPVPIAMTSVPISMTMNSIPVSMAMTSGPVSISATVSHPITPATPAPAPPREEMATPAPCHTPIAPPQTQSSMHPTTHQNIGQTAIANVASSLFPQVQVIHNPSCLQQLYPQPQMLLPGNLTIQQASLGQSLQNMGSAPTLSFQLQNKGLMDQKGVAVTGPTLIPAAPIQSVSTVGKGNGISTANLISGGGQVIATGGKSCVVGQMISAKSTAVIQGQAGFVPSTTSQQAVVIGQLGVISSQASILPTQNKAIGDNSRGKQPFIMSQGAALQPRSPIYPSPISSIGSSPQSFTSTQLKQFTSSPQIISSQTPAAMIASHSQILGSIQTLGAPLGQPIAWATPGGLQSPAVLTQNPIFIRSQHSDMFIQSPSPAPAALQAVSMASAGAVSVSATGIQVQKQKQVRPASSVATQTAISTSSSTHYQSNASVRSQVKQRARAQIARQTSSQASGTQAQQVSQTTSSQTQTNSPQSMKADAANQTKLSIDARSHNIQSKSTGTETKQQSAQVKPSHIPVIPITTALVTATTATNTNTNITLPVMVSKKEKREEVKKENEVSTQTLNKIPAVPRFLEKKDAATGNDAHIYPLLHEQAKEKQPQKAIVKPHILTHVIEGYVIQEALDPFPVSRSVLTASSQAKQVLSGKPVLTGVTPSLKGKVGKRKRGRKAWKKWRKQSEKTTYKAISSWNQGDEVSAMDSQIGNEELTKQVTQMEETEGETTDTPSGPESSVSPNTPSSHREEMEVETQEIGATPNKNPLKWTVLEVYEYIRGLPGCSAYAEEFRSQEIDGQALLLLKEDHLMSTMCMKLGPALKICARINTLKDEIP
ncbi:polyhomeotic-like protein 3 isoform X2 [Limulus polyphemus]|uniref:Polyhomeotic-like protein 3 isoform X2 n=1 Tax=Limulus polyphemus TaxID=6850 RepID=A0ABM1SVC5_LIMPO|nr:polyhomeotic-like protein 3 isoform X2 [Limulus polyphemus]